MKTLASSIRKNSAVSSALALCVAACSSELTMSESVRVSAPVQFGAETALGNPGANASAPFLRYAPDGRLFAVWTEDHGTARSEEKFSARGHHAMSGKMAPSPMRNILLAASNDSGKTWSAQRRVNSEIEAAQGEENGPKVAFSNNNRAYIVWSIPGAKGDKTRANIRFAMETNNGAFTPAQTLNEIKDAARFPIIETTPEGHFLVAWIDRRSDNPKPRQLYLVKISANGQAWTTNYAVGDGLCECCKLGIAFGDSGKTVYMVDRQVDGKKVRNHVLRKSTDGAATFGPPVEISDDGWQVPSCPHSGPSIGRDRRGWLHVTWFTLGRTEKEAGIYYSVSKDGGKSFAPRRLVHANTAPEILYNNLIAAADDRIYLAWTNLDSGGKSQVFVRTILADGQTWTPIQQISRARGNASRPVLAFKDKQLQVAWTETDGESSRVVLRSAEVGR